MLAGQSNTRRIMLGMLCCFGPPGSVCLTVVIRQKATLGSWLLICSNGLPDKSARVIGFSIGICVSQLRDMNKFIKRRVDIENSGPELACSDVLGGGI